MRSLLIQGAALALSATVLGLALGGAATSGLAMNDSSTAQTSWAERFHLQPAAARDAAGPASFEYAAIPDSAPYAQPIGQPAPSAADQDTATPYATSVDDAPSAPQTRYAAADAAPPAAADPQQSDVPAPEALPDCDATSDADPQGCATADAAPGAPSSATIS